MGDNFDNGSECGCWVRSSPRKTRLTRFHQSRPTTGRDRRSVAAGGDASRSILAVAIALLAVPGWSLEHVLVANNGDPLSVRVDRVGA